MSDGSLTEEEMAQLQEENVLLIDGSVGEGGGQVLRISVALAAILGRSVMIFKIRHNRSKPGMRAQHLEGIKLVSRLHNGTLEGDQLYSRKLLFRPGEFMAQPGIVADPGTAGSICLLKQVVLPTLLFGPCQNFVTLKGGTNASMAPQIDYATHVFGPIAKRMGVNFTADIIKRGYFPKGGGSMNLTVDPVLNLEPITLLERGEVKKTYIRSFVSRVDRSDAVKMFRTASDYIKKQLPSNIEEDIVIEKNSIGAAKGIICVSKTDKGCYLGGSAIGNSVRDSPVRLGKFAAAELLRTWETSACVDEYLQDQLIILMALAKGKSSIRTGPITEHTSTAILITSLFLGDIFTVTVQDDGSNIIECQGIGLENKFLKE